MATGSSYSPRFKAELVLSAAAGESLDALAARSGVEAARIERWREQLEAAFEERPGAAKDPAAGGFRTLVDQAPLGIFLVDAALRIVHVNPIAQPAFGGIPDLIGRDFEEVVHVLWTTQYADEIVERFRHTLETGEPYEAPARTEYRADRGVVEHYEWRIDRIPLADGSCGVVCYFRDVSSQIRARQALADSEARYRTLFESIDEGFCVVEMIFDEHGKPVDYRFLEINPAFEKHTGMQDALGKRMREMVPLHEDHWMETYGEVATTGKPIRFVNEARHLGGRWFDVYAFRLGGSDSRRVAILFNNITQRKQAEEALREHAARQGVLVRLGDALRPLSEPGPIQAAAARILGEHLGAGRVLYAEFGDDGGSARVRADYCAAGVASLVGVQRLEAFGAAFAANLAAGRTLVRTGRREPDELSEEVRAKYADLNIDACVTVPLIKAGRLAAFISAHQSAPRVWTENEVELMEEVAERTWMAVERARTEAALRAANAELTRADQQKDEFLAMLAHELRNPLAAIANIVPVLELATGEDADIAHWLRILDRQTNSLAALVDDLLDVSRVTRGQIELRLEQVDLVGIARRAAEGIRPFVDKQQQELCEELPDRAVPVEGDPVRLEQIIVNLLTNAVKYSPRGGRIVLALKEGEGVAELRVRDTGVGLAREMLGRVFDLFTQAEPPVDGPRHGLGIGLTVVKRLVELHRGRVAARSEGIGRGAEFIVTLPLAAAGPSPSPTVGRARSPRPRRILLVDDSEDVAATLARRLQGAGHEVSVAHDGGTALETARKAPPEVILLDLGMPGMDGYELARRLREIPALHDTRLAALTGYGQPRDREHTREAGFDAHFVKPVGIDVLNAFIERDEE